MRNLTKQITANINICPRLWLSWDLHLYLYSYSKCTAYIYIYIYFLPMLVSLQFLSCSLVLQVYSRSRPLSIMCPWILSFHRVIRSTVQAHAQLVQRIFVQRQSAKRVRQIENRHRCTRFVCLTWQHAQQCNEKRDVMTNVDMSRRSEFVPPYRTMATTSVISKKLCMLFVVTTSLLTILLVNAVLIMWPIRKVNAIIDVPSVWLVPLSFQRRPPGLIRETRQGQPDYYKLPQFEGITGIEWTDCFYIL